MNRNHFLLLGILAALVFGANLGGFSIYILDEAKNSGCAMEMYQNNEWIVPTFNQELRTDKPPLHYFFMRTAYTLGGINPFTARVFSAVMGVLMVLGLYYFSSRLISTSVALLAALICIASLQLAFQFHLAVPDPYLLFFLTTGWLAWITAWKENKPGLYYIAYICIGFATLAKGPLAPFLSALLMGSFLLFERQINWAVFKKVRFFSGALVFIAIVAPWFVLVTLKTNGEWLNEFIFKHNVSRFTEPMEGHGGFPLESIVVAFIGLMPFTFFLPLKFRSLVGWFKTESVGRYFILGAGVVIIFFAFSRTILPTYPEPAFPFLALVLAYALHQLYKNASSSIVIPGVIYLILVAAIPWAAANGFEADGNLKAAQWSMLLYFLPISALTGLILLMLKKVRYAILVYIAGNIITLLALFYILVPAMDEQNPVRQATEQLGLKSTPLPVVSYRIFNPAFQFALQRPLPNAQDLTDLRNLLPAGKKVYVVTRKKYLKDLESLNPEIVFEKKDLFEKHVTVVLLLSGGQPE